MDDFKKSLTQYQTLAAQALISAKKNGADQAEVSVSAHQGVHVNVLDGEVETIEYDQDVSLQITVFTANRSGSASINALDETSIETAVQKACAFSAFAEEDPCANLVDKAYLAGESEDLAIYHPQKIDVEQMITDAKESEAVAVKPDNIRVSEGAYQGAGQSLFVYANSFGMNEGYYKTSYSNSCAVIAGESDEKLGMQRGAEWHSVRQHNSLMSAAEIGRLSAEQAIARLNARAIKTQELPVVFEASIAKTLFGAFFGAISGRSQYQKNSYLLNCLGESVFPEWLSIHEQPRLLQGYSSLPFDNDGVTTRNKTLVEQGRVQSYILGRYSARKLNMKPTGNASGVRNIRFDAPLVPYQSMLDEIGTGVIITELMGQGINGLTGDYSRGAFGFYFENGKIQYPVEGMTVAGNLKSMFHNIRAFADDVDTKGGTHCGSIWIDGMTVAGQ